MKNFYNYFVSGDIDGTLFFDEDFDPNGFCIRFNEDDEDKRTGYIEFELDRCHATVVVYGDPEGLSAHIEGIDLMNDPIGQAIVAQYEEHRTGKMYRMAMLFTDLFLNPIDPEE